jgi:UDP-glucose 4-epimerase
MKRVIVTGATGFVGANLAKTLLSAGHEVYLLVRDERKAWRIKHLLPHVHLVKSSLLDPEGLSAEIKRIRPEWIFHLAAFGAYSWQDNLSSALQTNLLGTINFVEACRKTDFEVFINTGSSSEYGAKDHPAAENDYLEPNSYYAVTKASATLFCRYTAQRFRLPMYTLRLYSVYGPYEEPGRLIPTLIVKGLQGKFPPFTHPDSARDYIFSDDVIKAYLSVASSSPNLPSGEVYNVGTGTQTPLKQVVEITKEIFKIDALPVWGSMESREWDTSIWVSDTAKLRMTGWIPEYDFPIGYRRTIDWFRENPDIVEAIYRNS